MKSSGIGGQAVLEGVMMKNKSHYAVAVRKPDNEIEIKKDEFKSISGRIGLFRLPVFRGMAAFAESLVLGMRTLTYSSSFYEEEEENKKKEVSKTKETLMDIGVVGLSVLLAVVIFILFPLFISSMLGKIIKSETVQLILEGVLRLGMFIAYVALISRLNDIKRVFMYHGAEHKCINCVERGFELTVANVKKQSKCHKRCGTSFMLVVMLVSFVLFMFIRADAAWLRYILRIVLIPVIAGISYEFIRLAGNTENRLVDILSRPGLWMQGLTTKEPDDSMIEVAIASVEAVFDWRAYQENEGIARYHRDAAENDRQNNSGKNSSKKKNTFEYQKNSDVSKKDAVMPKTAEKDNAADSKSQKKQEQQKYEKAAKEKGSRGAVRTAAADTENVRDALAAAGEELSALDKVFCSDIEDKSSDKAADEAAAAREKQKELKNKVRVGQKNDLIGSMSAPEEEEEDEILRALDKFFVYEGEKTVMEMGQPEQREQE